MQLNPDSSSSSYHIPPPHENIDFSQAGESKGIFRKKLLSYKKDKGWELKEMNIGQLALRKLGFYKSTHLSKINRKINTKDITDEPEYRELGLRDDCELAGWDIEVAPLSAEKKEEEILNEWKDFANSVQALPLDDWIEKMREIPGKIKEFNKYFKSNDKSVKNADKIINGLLDQLKKGEIDYSECSEKINTICNTMFNRGRKAHFSHSTSKEDALILGAADSGRQQSLIDTIREKQEENPNRTIFVIAGATHLLRLDDSIRGYNEINNLYNENKFIIFKRKNEKINHHEMAKNMKKQEIKAELFPKPSDVE